MYVLFIGSRVGDSALWFESLQQHVLLSNGNNKAWEEALYKVNVTHYFKKKTQKKPPLSSTFSSNHKPDFSHNDLIWVLSL